MSERQPTGIPEPEHHMSWCDPARCERWTYPTEHTEEFHRLLLLDTVGGLVRGKPEPLRVEVYRYVRTDEAGARHASASSVHADGIEDGISVRQLSLVAAAYARAAELLADEVAR